MAKWVNSSVQDGGLNVVKNSAVVMLLLNNYSANDSYATVTASGNVVASVAMSPTDYTITGASNAPRVLTTATKSATAGAPAVAGNHHIAFTDGASTVLWVTDETGEATCNAGDGVSFPSVTLTSNQPT